MKAFIKNLSESEDKIDEWNERIWMLLVDGATVHRDSSITFKLYNGIDIKTK
jgi:site-specific DNA recombinase